MAGTARPLWRKRMDARARDNRRDLDRRIADLRDRAFRAYDGRRALLATVHIRIDAHGVARHTVTVMDAPPDLEEQGSPS